MTSFLKDLRFAFRGLVRRPAFTIVAVLTLALGIGANTAVFTLVDGVLLSPLPFRDADRLVSIQHLGRDGQDELPISQGLYVVYGEHARSLEELAMFTSTSVNLVVEGEAERIAVQVVTPGFFGVLGVSPAMGRGFDEAEGAPAGPLAVVLSHGFWRDRFGGDPDVIGRTVDINGQLRPVVGVMPRDFGYPDREAVLWMPLVVDPVEAPLGAFGPSAVGRLAAGATRDGVAVELQGLIGRLAELFPESGAPAFLNEVGLKARVMPLKESLVGDLRATLWILLGTVGFVLLIACANVANLLLVRAEGRQRELALRMAVGAGRGQIARWLLSESLLLAMAGGAVGVALAAVAVRASLGMVPTSIPRVAEVGVDLRVLGFTAIVTLGCALVAGAFPLFHRGGHDLAAELREGARGATVGRERHRVRNALVVTQIALALILLVGSGLMYRSFQALRAVDPGFRAENVLTAQITVPTAEIEGWEATAGFFRQLRDRLLAEPGVLEVGFAQGVPLDGSVSFSGIEVEDHPRSPSELPIFASNNLVDVGYLESVGITLLEGRTLRSGDGAEAGRSVVVSRSFAREHWPDGSALGRRVRLGFEGEDWYGIVGVVEDAHYGSLEGPAEQMVYWPTTIGPRESPQPARTLQATIRTAADPLSFVPVLRRVVQEQNSRIPVSNPRLLESIADAATSRISFTMTLLAAASGIALLLGLVGIYGVISYVVSQRTREIGVRMAMGATAPTVRGMVVRQGLALATIGVGVGLLAAAALSRLMASLLYGVGALDPLTYGVVAGLLVAVATAASWIPAHRASRVNPSIALRSD